MKLVVLDGYTLNPGDLSWDPIRKFGELTVYDRTPADLIDERILDCEIVITNKTPIDEELIRRHPKMKMIAVLATGYNVVDVKAARENGVVVCNVPTYGTDAVAQYVFALLLGLAHRVEKHDQTVRAGKWTNHQDFCYWETPLFELSGKSMGIIGMGKIGAKTAEIAQAFGMTVLAYDLNPDRSLESKALHFVTLDEVFKHSDVISLHVPLFESTRNLVNKNTIAQMKKGVYIINTSRGPLVNEHDLYEALLNGHVAGAAVDVVSVEPIKSDNSLLKAPNMIITPHIAWAPVEARKRLMDTVVENIESYIEGRPINTVDR